VLCADFYGSYSFARTGDASASVDSRPAQMVVDAEARPPGSCSAGSGLQGAPSIPPAPHTRPRERCNLFEVRTPSYTPTVAFSNRVVCSLLRPRRSDIDDVRCDDVRFSLWSSRCATHTTRTARAPTRALQLV
jgi:hypothetical protein